MTTNQKTTKSTASYVNSLNLIDRWYFELDWFQQTFLGKHNFCSQKGQSFVEDSEALTTWEWFVISLFVINICCYHKLIIIMEILQVQLNSPMLGWGIGPHLNILFCVFPCFHGLKYRFSTFLTDIAMIA